ncbi:MAG: Asp-tRNA(Asn)/Glu-tRNA(Gln) amidotransferase subunit GatC [Candidatus Micrarchaeota archaeon]
MDAEKISKIARISLTEKEKKSFEAQLSQILKWAEQIQEVKQAKSGGEEAYFTEKTNIFRDDTVSIFDDCKLITQNFPKTKRGKLEVPRSL